MEYLSENLRSEYIYQKKLISVSPGLKSPLINELDVLRAHFILADYFTDNTAKDECESMLIGVKNQDLLSSAVNRQICSFGGKQKYTDSFDICATLFFGLVKNHPFNDGNKRTALLTLLNQLLLFGHYPNRNIKEYERLVLSIADNTIEEKYHSVHKKFKKHPDKTIKTISYLLRRMVDEKNHSFHCDITMKEFISALEKQGVKCDNTGSKVKFKRTTKKALFPITYTYTIKFYGLTRVIEPGVARDTFDALHLFDDHASYNSVFEGKEPMYKLIAQFEEPLRRLKDE